jgi:hypothetical protein
MAQAARKIEYSTEAHAKADELLAGIVAATEQLEGAREECTAEVDLVTGRFVSRIVEAKQEAEKLAKALEKLMKVNRYKLFDGTDRVDLENGALLFAIEERVKRAKDVLKRLEETGAEEKAFIVTKAVNWDELEKWTDERLIEIGTERKREEKFSFEVKSLSPQRTQSAQRKKKGKK